MDRSSQPCASPNCSYNNASIECKGSCRQRFHAVCVGLSAADVAVISTLPNLFWFCVVCREHTWKDWLSGIPTKRAAVAGSSSCGSPSCIFNDQHIKCDGSCGKDFHGMCVKLSKSDLVVIGSSANILWVCDGCNNKVPPVLAEPDDVTTEFEAEQQMEDDSMVVKLETKFESIIAKLTKLNENLEHGAYTPPDSTPNSEGNSDSEKDDRVAEYAAVDNDITVTKITEAVKDAIVGVPVVDLTKNDNGSHEDSAINNKLPTVETPMNDSVRIFTFGSANHCESTVENLNFSFSIPTDSVELFKQSLAAQKPKPPKQAPVKPAEPEKDSNNNNIPIPEKPPQEAAPVKKFVLAPMVKKIEPVLKVRDDSKFALWIKFDDPDISSREACSLVRQALRMSAKESVAARNVVPGHIRFTGQALYASFKVDLDARWRKKALDGATWSSVADYREHAEWVDRW